MEWKRREISINAEYPRESAKLPRRRKEGASVVPRYRAVITERRVQAELADDFIEVDPARASGPGPP